MAFGIPVNRVLDRLDDYLAKRDHDAAERHLQYWLSEAEQLGDRRGALAVRNEQIGLYRKLGREPEAMEAVEAALMLARRELDGTVTLATTLVNAATAYNAFGQAAESLPLYGEAQALYEALLPPGDERLGGLYNNMALAQMEAGDTDAAERLFRKALDVMLQVPGGEAEVAITYCNLADLAALRWGPAAEEIGDDLEAALGFLNAETLPHDSYYAYVCERCAPIFGSYGRKEAEETLLRRAREYDEGT